MGFVSEAPLAPPIAEQIRRDASALAVVPAPSRGGAIPRGPERELFGEIPCYFGAELRLRAGGHQQPLRDPWWMQGCDRHILLCRTNSVFASHSAVVARL